jgi:hypothetical protein
MLYTYFRVKDKISVLSLSLLNSIDIIKLELLPADFPVILKTRAVLKGNLNDIDRLFTSC